MHALPDRPETFVEPFAGGGIISLTVAMEGLADRVFMSDIDPEVAAVWQVILEGDYKALIDRIVRFDISREAVVHELSLLPTDLVHQAFQTVLRNRVQRGGIMAPGASLFRNGENGRGVASRWYPTTLARRIMAIANMRHIISFQCVDGLGVMRKFKDTASTAFFVDPPYTAGSKKAGRRLYTHNQINHHELFDVISSVQGPAMITYEDAAEPAELAERYSLATQRVVMSNTHHSTMFELVATKGRRTPVQISLPLM